jgi:hypothetical protein
VTAHAKGNRGSRERIDLDHKAEALGRRTPPGFSLAEMMRGF